MTDNTTLDPLGDVRSYTALERDHAALVRELEALAVENARLRNLLNEINDHTRFNRVQSSFDTIREMIEEALAQEPTA